MINNYNYREFLSECLDSVLNQSVKIDRIIIVDDGSTDQSANLVGKYCEKFSNVLLIEKENGGQLSCFNAGCAEIENEDIVFLLDSDDLFPCDYVENALKNFSSGTDLAIFSAKEFFGGDDLPLASSIIAEEVVYRINSSSNLTRRTTCWIGSPTSALAIRGKSYKEIFPYNDEGRWKTRADDVIVFASSILGMAKTYMPHISISYRVHGRNNFNRKKINDKGDALRILALEKLFNEMCRRAGVGVKGSAIAACAEVACMPKDIRSKFFIPSATKLNLHKFIEKTSRLLGLY